MGRIKLLVKKEINDSLIYSVETVFSGILSIAFYVFIANFLTLADVGAYSLALVYSSIIAGIANLGLSAGYERTYFEFTKNLQEKGSLITSVQFFSLISIITFVFLGILFSSQLSNLLIGDDRYQSLWVLVLIGVNISEFSKFYFAYLKNTRQAKFFSLMHAVQVAVNFLLAYIFLVILGKDFYWLGSALLLSHALVLVLSFYHQLKNIPFIVNSKYFVIVAKISLPLTPRVLIGFIGTQFDKIILSQVSSLESLGVYSVAHRIAMTIYMFMNALGRVWTPKLYEHLFEKKLDSNTRFLSVFMFISFFPSVVLILFSKEVLLVFPESYSWGYKIIIFLSLYYSVLFIGKINGPQLIFAKQAWLLSGLSLVNILISILITYPLASQYGAVGASAGMLISSIIMGVIYFYFANKYAPLIWEYKTIVFLFLCLVIASSTVFIVEETSIGSVSQFLIKLLILVVFSLYGFRMRFLRLSNFT